MVVAKVCFEAGCEQRFKTVELGAVPSVGEKLQIGQGQIYEVVDVTHTPSEAKWSAILTVRASE